MSNLLNWVSNLISIMILVSLSISKRSNSSSKLLPLKSVTRIKIKIMFLSLIAEESLSSRVETTKFIPKVTDMYVVFAVKSGTKLLSYAAAVRRQLFGKWLHLNMRKAGSHYRAIKQEMRDENNCQVPTLCVRHLATQSRTAGRGAHWLPNHQVCS